jgi:arylsulfatase A-like enzyme
MWRRGLTGLSIALLLIGCELETQPSSSPERIILIVVDTLRRDHVSVYASKLAPSEVETPNIDRLAAGGQIFQNASSAFHSTTMSMAALFSGRTPSIEFGDARAALDWNTFASCGMSRFARVDGDDACVPDAVETLAEDLRAAGYWTAGIVSNKLLFRPYGFDQGFDLWFEVGRVPPGAKLNARQSARIRTAQHVNKSVLSILANRKSDRFFLYIHYIDVHDWILFDISYAESVRRFDKHLGELLDALESEGLLEDTAIIFTSDHGEMLIDHHLDFKISRHYGNPSFEPLLRVPLIVKPSLDTPSDAFVRGQDIRGLVREIAGLEGSPAPDLEPDELLVTERFYQTYRKGNWKSMWERNQKHLMLFDLDADPNELTNLAGERTDVLKAHRKRVDELVIKFSSDERSTQRLSEEDLDRLRALGYLE